MNINDITKSGSATALSIRKNLDQVESALSEFDRVSAGLADLAERFPADLVFDVRSTKGMAEAIAHRAAWRDPRISVEKFRKLAKAPVLALGKDIDARASWLTERLLEGETPVDEQIKAEERRKEDERQAKIAKEFARVEAIQAAIGDIHMLAMGMTNKSSSAIESARLELEALQIDPLIFQECIDQARVAKTSALEKLGVMHRAALHAEAQAAKLAADREELEALRKLAAETRAREDAARAAQLAADRERLAEDRRKQDALLATQRAAQAKADADAKSARDEADRLAHVARAEADRLASDKRAQEQRKLDAQAAEQRKLAETAAAAETKLRNAAPQLLAALRVALPYVTKHGTAEECMLCGKAMSDAS
jgi:hypothetical protein